MAVSLSKQSMAPHAAGLPIVGILPSIIKQHPLPFLKNTAREYGDFVELKIGPQYLYLVSSPEYLQQILRDNYPNYKKPAMMYKPLRAIIGNGLIRSEGDFWLRQRRMIQPYFHRKYLNGMAHIMIETIVNVMAQWSERARTGSPIDLSEQMSYLTMEIVLHTIFGMESLSPTEKVLVGHDISLMLDLMTTRQYLPFVPDAIPLPGDSRIKNAIHNTQSVVNKIIEERRQKAIDSSDLIGMLLEATDDETNTQMTNQQVYDEVVTFFTAGYETTAATLTWLWILLDKTPQVLQKLQAEIDTVLEGRRPTIEDLPKLVYTRNTFQEVLRIYPVAPVLPRRAVNSDEFGPYHIPAGSMMLMFFYGLHHNPAIWKDPEVFNPDRFLPENSENRSAFAYLPFSAGQRKCIGEDFALMEATLAIALILQNFEVKLQPNQGFKEKFASSLRPSPEPEATLITKH